MAADRGCEAHFDAFSAGLSLGFIVERGGTPRAIFFFKKRCLNCAAERRARIFFASNNN
jgi:hypothetical protein